MSARDRASAKRAEAPINTLEQFRARCAVVASRYAIGRIDLIEAVDTLQDFAFTRSLVDEIGQDEVQAILSATLASMQNKERTDEYEGLSSTFAQACLAADEVLERYQEVGMSNEPPGNSRDEQEASKGPPRFRLRAFKTITVGSELVYLIKGIIPRVGLVVVWGPPKCGKSFWTFDLVMHPALGWKYRGRRVQHGAVVYLALEGGKGFEARIEAFRQRHLPEHHDQVPFFLIADALNLVKDHPELIGCIRLQAKGNLPVAVVIDTLNRSLAGSESDDKDMAAYIRAADAIRAAFGCVVIILHHCGVDSSRPRGHTSLIGAVDAQLAVKRDAAENIVVIVERMNDGPEGETLLSKLDAVEVGNDVDGDPITSCVVVPVDGAAVRTATTRKLSDRQKLALDALAGCALDHGTSPPATFGLPVGLLAIKVADWRDELYSRGVLDRDAKNPREDFRRVKNRLQARGLIGERDGVVWRAMS
jgi:AAA domain